MAAIPGRNLKFKEEDINKAKHLDLEINELKKMQLLKLFVFEHIP